MCKSVVNIFLVGLGIFCMNNAIAEQKKQVIVIGAGLAGMEAAQRTARNGGFETTIIAGPKPGGLLVSAGEVENMPGIPKMRGYEIVDLCIKKTQELGVKMVYDTVKAIRPVVDEHAKRVYELELESGAVLTAHAVIIASGSAPKKLGAPGEETYWGRGVSSCAICDCFVVKDGHAVIIGGGDVAIEHVLELVHYAKRITVLVRGDKMRAPLYRQEKIHSYPHVTVCYNTELERIDGDSERARSITIKNNKNGSQETLAVDCVFLAIGHTPNTLFCRDFVACREDGTIFLASRTQETSVPGIFAAGDVADNRYRQGGVAWGDGIKAGMDAIMYLNNL